MFKSLFPGVVAVNPFPIGPNPKFIPEKGYIRNVLIRNRLFIGRIIPEGLQLPRMLIKIMQSSIRSRSNPDVILSIEYNSIDFTLPNIGYLGELLPGRIEFIDGFIRNHIQLAGRIFCNSCEI